VCVRVFGPFSTGRYSYSGVVHAHHALLCIWFGIFRTRSTRVLRVSPGEGWVKYQFSSLRATHESDIWPYILLRVVYCRCEWLCEVQYSEYSELEYIVATDGVHTVPGIIQYLVVYGRSIASITFLFMSHFFVKLQSTCCNLVHVHMDV
jgi:hypothetical protein